MEAGKKGYLLANDLEHLSHENGFSFVSAAPYVSMGLLSKEDIRSFLGKEGRKGYATGAEMSLEMLQTGEGSVAVLARKGLAWSIGSFLL